MRSTSFINCPDVSAFGVGSSVYAKGLELMELLPVFIDQSDLFAGNNVSVTFVHCSTSSIICILESVDSKVVLKVPMFQEWPNVEVKFFDAWNSVGVKVPAVLEEGKLGSSSYILMEHIDALTLKDKYTENEMLVEKKYVDAGATLRRMHSSKSYGYGWYVNGSAEYATFMEWLSSPGVRACVDYVRACNVLYGIDMEFEESIRPLVEYVGDSTSSTYCHFDFSVKNIFDTHPLTVFDPNPIYNHPYVDLGRSLLFTIVAGSRPDSYQHVIEGYFNGVAHDHLVVTAAVVCNAFTKLPFWYSMGMKDRIIRLREYLSSVG